MAEEISALSVFRMAMRTFTVSEPDIQPWRKRFPPGRTHGSCQYLVKEIIGALTKLAGGDLPSLLRDLVPLQDSIPFIETIAPEAYSALRRIANPFNQLKPGQKGQWVSAMRGPGNSEPNFSLRDVYALGWKFGKDQWCPSVPHESNKRGRPAVLPDLVADVESALVLSSTESRTKKIKANDGDVQLRRMQVPFLQSYHDFPRKDELSLASFYRYIPRHFKQRGHVRDTCDYCQDATVARHSVAHSKAIYPEMADKSVDEIVHELGGKPWHHPLADKVDLIYHADIHTTKVAKQRIFYEHLCAYPSSNILGVTVDWKCKETVPICSVETSEIAFGKSQLAVLGVHFFWLDNGCKQDAFCTAVSNTVTENAYCTIAAIKRAFQKMIDAHHFDPHQFDEIMFWCDTGRHFVAYEFAHYVCVDLPSHYDVVASINFFAEKHGKSHVDGFFNCIGAYIARVLPEKDIFTASDYVSAVDKGWRLVKSTNDNRGLITPIVITFVLAVPTEGTYTCNELQVRGLKSISCLQGRPDGVITLRDTSDNPNEVSIPATIATSVVKYTLTISDLRPMRTPKERTSWLRYKQRVLAALMNAGNPVAPYVPKRIK